MKLLLALTALLAAALVAVVFPDMKKILLLIPFALAAIVCTAGCNSVTQALRAVPDGHHENLELAESGKFTNTTAKFGVLDKDEDVLRAEKLEIRHSNPWFTNISLKSDRSVLDVSPGAKKRTTPAPKPPAAVAATVPPSSGLYSVTPASAPEPAK